MYKQLRRDKDHEDVIFALYSVGQSYYYLNNHTQAQAYYQLSLEMAQRLFSDNPDHELIKDIRKVMAFCKPG